jgi:hypothetical protein
VSFDVPDLSAPQPGEGVRYTCTSCRVASPAVESNFTLISARFGWRLARRLDETRGEWVFEWHCPECWSRRSPSTRSPTNHRR